MWVVYFFISYLILALLIPTVWPSGLRGAERESP